MVWLAAYAEEHAKYPREQRIKLTPRLAELTTMALAKAFQLNVCVSMTSRTNGKCHAGYHYASIELPFGGCSLGMVLHELAHAYNRQKYHNTGHTGTFKNALSLLYHQGRPLFEKILKDAMAQMVRECQEAKERSQKLSERVQREATKRAAFEVERKTPAFKIQRLQIRIKRLETRSRRLVTLLKSARRSLGIYERMAMRKNEIKESV